MLYRAAIADTLSAQGLTVLWTVLGEKHRMGGETWDQRRQDDYHWVEFSASYFLAPEGPVLNHTHGVRKRARGNADCTLDWAV
ncbi:hypothetical protein GCM10023205_61770 [Yinghuangia aomiensis]|uniref:Uncharacterized protein n=1 Tax=Yinghuangia aomiensis TaxID=676205 RepID=A0ABP9I149_9ACTN